MMIDCVKIEAGYFLCFKVSKRVKRYF